MRVESDGHSYAVGAQGRHLLGFRGSRSRQGRLLYCGELGITVVYVSFGSERVFIGDPFFELDAGSGLLVTHILRGVEKGCDAWVRMERGKQ